MPDHAAVGSLDVLMLIRRAALDRIVSGEIDLVFRRWKQPTVKTGGSLRTAAGMLDIVRVERTSRSAITAADAHRAGYPTKAALLAFLDGREGDLYRIEVRPGGTDPRIALRENDELSPADLDAVVARLDRLDAGSIGPWTRATLRLLADHPHVRAQDLVDSIGRDKPSFKNDVRKLKALGLTISHSPGYELSPRGRRVLDHLGV